MIDPADRLGVADEPDPDDEAHAEPEGDAGDDGQARHLARRQPRRAVDPEAHRAAGDQRKAEGERNRVAGERSERGQPIRHVDLEMPQGQTVVAGQGEIAQRGKPEGHRDLVAAGRREGGLELLRIDANERADEDDRRNRNDQQAEGQPQSPQQRPARRDRRRPSREAVVGIGRPAVAGVLVAGRAFLGLMRHPRPLLLASRPPISLARAPGKRASSDGDALPGPPGLVGGVGQNIGLEAVLAVGPRPAARFHRADEGVEFAAIGAGVALEKEVEDLVADEALARRRTRPSSRGCCRPESCPWSRAPRRADHSRRWRGANWRFARPCPISSP